MKPYDHKKIEKKWQKTWVDTNVYKTLSAKQARAKKLKPYYVLDMFPYPSGAGLHVGHPRGYIASDVFARMKRMSGFNVLHPMGFDSFGLPAEQYAIKTGKNPGPFTNELVKRYKEQLSILGFSYDWNRQVATHDPEYYRWTQWIFLQIYNSWYDKEKQKARPITDLEKEFAKNGNEKVNAVCDQNTPTFSKTDWKNFSDLEKQNMLMKYRLAYEGYAEVNWCAEMGTVLANDEVIEVDGKMVSERGEFPVEKKSMRQWFMRITAYADRLIDGLDEIDWSNSIKEIQRNWIGKSEGSEIEFGIVSDKKTRIFGEKITGSIERSIVKVILRNKDGKILVLDSKGFGLDLPGGAIESNESLEKTAVRELQEETEYTNFRFVKNMSSDFINYYHLNRQQYFHGKIHVLLYDLINDEKSIKNVQSGENETKDKWINPQELYDIFPKDSAYKTALKKSIFDYISIQKNQITVFTTRADTLFGVTYVVLAPEHDLVQQLKSHITNWDEVEQYIASVKSKSDEDRTAAKEKTGIQLEGIFAVNPVSDEQVPVWIADYILAGYGTGAVMAVPAHDERDFEFAQKYDLPVKHVVSRVLDYKDHKEGVPHLVRKTVDPIIRDKEGNFYLIRESEEDVHFAGGGVEEGESDIETARREIIEETGFTDFIIGNPINLYISATGYRAAKNRNQTGYGTAYEVVLNSTQQIPSEIDQGIHTVVKVSKDDVLKSITWEHHRWIFEAYLNGPKAFTDEGLLIDSGQFNNMNSTEARKAITEFVGGKLVTKYKMRDAIFARQRYWGEPIPLIHEKDGLIEAIPEKQLPLTLPPVKSYAPSGNGEGPLATVKSWVTAGYETNTMPGWAGSSWYFLRYTDPTNKKKFADESELDYWFGKNGGVNMYVGGAEHATGHLLYSRFWHKVLKDLGYVKTEEPFQALRNQGMIGGADGRKMSKRWGNVINPDDVVRDMGADTLRVYESFMGPFDAHLPWSIDGIAGARRFIERIWRFQTKVSNTVKTTEHLEKVLHKTIKKVSEDIQNFAFNTAVSSMMIFANELEKAESINIADFKKFLQILAPFAPHITDELWASLGEKKSIHSASWPTFDPKKVIDTTITIGIQINGKVRAEIEINREESSENIQSIVLAMPEIIKWIDGKEIKKFIYVPGRVINIVV